MKEDLKKELHQLIDKIEDEHVLNILKEEAVAYSVSGEISDELTIEQMKQINDGIAEMDKGEFITHEEFQQHMERWKKGLYTEEDLGKK